MSSPLAPDMVRHLKAVSDPSMSPNGDRVVFTFSWVDEESLESRSRLHLLALNGAKGRPRSSLPGDRGMLHPGSLPTAKLWPSCDPTKPTVGKSG